MTRQLRLHLILMLAVVVTFGLLTEYFGWKIVERMVGEPRFPGFLTSETWGSVIRNASGALLLGLVLSLLALPFKRFRRDWRRILPFLAWVGVVVFYGYMAVLIWIGFRSV
jgi:hypothetical protein